MKKDRETGVKIRKENKVMWEMYHMDQRISVFHNKKESQRNDRKNVKRKEIEMTNEPNEISYVGNVSHEQQYSDEAREEKGQETTTDKNIQNRFDRKGTECDEENVSHATRCIGQDKRKMLPKEINKEKVKDIEKGRNKTIYMK